METACDCVCVVCTSLVVTCCGVCMGLVVVIELYIGSNGSLLNQAVCYLFVSMWFYVCMCTVFGLL